MKKIIPFKKDIIFKTNLAEITSISLEHSLHKQDDELITGSFIISGNYKISDNSINVDSFSYDLPFDINIDDKYDISAIEIDIDDFYYEIINNNILSVNIDVCLDKIEDKPLIEDVKEDVEESKDEELVTNDTRETANAALDLVDDLLNVDTQTNKVEEQETKPIIEEERNIEEDERCIEDEDDNITNIEIEKTELQNKKTEVKIEKQELKEEKIMKEEKVNNSEIQIKSLFTTFDNETETYSTYKVYLVREGDNIETIMQKYAIDRETLGYYNDLNDLKIGDKLIIPTVSNA